MARIAGVDLPRNKRVEIALTYIYGIGRTIGAENPRQVRYRPRAAHGRSDRRPSAGASAPSSSRTSRSRATCGVMFR